MVPRGVLLCWVELLISDKWPDLGLLALLVLLARLDLLPLHMISTSSFSLPESEFPQDCSDPSQSDNGGGWEVLMALLVLSGT